MGLDFLGIKGTIETTIEIENPQNFQVYDLFERKRNAMQEKILEVSNDLQNVLGWVKIRDYNTLLYGCFRK